MATRALLCSREASRWVMRPLRMVVLRPSLLKAPLCATKFWRRETTSGMSCMVMVLMFMDSAWVKMVDAFALLVALPTS